MSHSCRPSREGARPPGGAPAAAHAPRGRLRCSPRAALMASADCARRGVLDSPARRGRRSRSPPRRACQPVESGPGPVIDPRDRGPRRAEGPEAHPGAPPGRRRLSPRAAAPHRLGALSALALASPTRLREGTDRSSAVGAASGAPLHIFLAGLSGGYH